MLGQLACSRRCTRTVVLYFKFLLSNTNSLSKITHLKVLAFNFSNIPHLMLQSSPVIRSSVIRYLFYKEQFFLPIFLVLCYDLRLPGYKKFGYTTVIRSRILPPKRPLVWLQGVRMGSLHSSEKPKAEIYRRELSPFDVTSTVLPFCCTRGVDLDLQYLQHRSRSTVSAA